MNKIQKGVLFVCLGNICRSPIAHGVFQQLMQTRCATSPIVVDSAGTGDWHIGSAPDPRAIAVCQRRGVDLNSQRARQVEASDFDSFDAVLAMDGSNLEHLQTLAPASYQGQLERLLTLDPTASLTDVPDPYYGTEADFEQVFDLIERACEKLLQRIEAP